MAISINWATKVITIPQADLTFLGGTSYALNTDTFRLALKDLEDSPEGMPYPDTHRHNTVVSLGGLQYARIIEIINGYTITFENGSYSVSLIGSNNNILDVTNLNNVAVRSNNSAGLVQMQEIQQSSFEGKVWIKSSGGTAGTAYPIGTGQRPVSNLADAKFIAALRGIDDYGIIGNLTIGATDDVTALIFEGQGATLNVARTTVTLTQGCITTNSQWHHCKITGYQGGESLYHDCVIDGLDNAHCIYERCGLMDGTTRGYTIRQTSAVSSGHASYFKECYSDEGTAILDRNGARLNVTFDGWHGRLKIINQNHATQSGQCWIHMNGGTLIVDATCTKGIVTVTGFGTLINQSQGTEVDASGFMAEQFSIQTINIESFRQTHQGFGARWFVDPVNGNDLAPGNSPSSPLRTVSAAITEAVSGRGDVIYLLSPSSTLAVITERIVINKEDVHLRGPGRGFQFQPLTPDNSTPIISVTANNCSMAGFIVRANASDTVSDCVVISGKFSRLDKLYVVGAGQGVGTGSGIVYTHGDYHELIDCESEKCGRSGLLIKDMSGGTGNGSPREISVKGGNYYLNGKDGIEFEGSANTGAGTSNRLNRILDANIHNNFGYGIRIDSYTSGTVINDGVMLHTNTLGNISDSGISTYNDVHDVNVIRMVGTALHGDGSEGDKFRSVLVP
jgi:hypothetical protein